MALAILGVGPWVRVAHAAEAPVITNVWLETASGPVTAVNEAQSFFVKGTFTDGDASDRHSAYIQIGSSFPETFTSLPLGARSFSATRVYPDDAPSGTPQDPFTLTVRIQDSSGLWSNTWTMTVTVRNVAPTVTGLLLQPSSILDHESVQASGSFADPGTKDTFTLNLSWGDGSPAFTKPYLATDPKTFSATHLYTVPGQYNIVATVTDDDTGVGTLSSALTVGSRNTPPSGFVLSGASVVEGDEATFHGQFADPDAADTHSVVIDWGDSSQSSFTLAAGALSFDVKHTFKTYGTYAISATVSDGSVPASASLSFDVIKRNTPPSALSLSAVSVIEGDLATLHGEFADPDTTDAHTVVVQWGDGLQSLLALAAGALSFDATHTYANYGTYPINVSVADGAASTSGSLSYIVFRRNHAPADLVLSTTGAVEGGSGTLALSFTDPDPLDWHRVSVDWGDGSPVTDQILDAGVLSVTASHVYVAAGAYTVSVTVSDTYDASVGGATTLSVRVRTASELVDALASTMYGWSLEEGTENSLMTKVRAAQAEFGWGRGNVCNRLGALANEVSAQTGKSLSLDEAGAFWSLIAELNDRMDCPQLQDAMAKAGIRASGAKGAASAAGTSDADDPKNGKKNAKDKDAKDKAKDEKDKGERSQKP
jgi:hypothetical protein